jgi:hypothetical protein
MKFVRPLAGILLATLLCVPAFADEVELLPPGGGLDPTKTQPVDDPPRTQPRPSSRSSSSSSSSDYTEEQPGLQARHFGLQIALSCAVADQPNSIVVVNTSNEDLPPGTRIKWQLKGEGQVGFFALLGTLKGGKQLVADNVLQSEVAQSAKCVARVL